MSCQPLQSPEALWRTELADLVAAVEGSSMLVLHLTGA